MVPGPAVNSPMYYPQLLAADRQGNVFVAFDNSATNGRSVVRIEPAGVLSFLLNSAGASGTPNVGGAALSSPFGYVTGLASDADGNVYVASSATYSIYKIDTAGQLSLVAGTGTRSASGGPLGTGAPTSVDITPSMLAVSADGSAVYFLDARANRIGKIAGGAVTSVAGNGAFGTPTPGTSGSPVPAVNSPMNPGTYDGLAVDSSGDLFVAGSECVTMVAAGTGELTRVLGTCGTAGTPAVGPASSSQVSGLSEIAVDRNDDLYVTDRNNFRIEKVTDPDSGTGTLSFVAGDGVNGTVTAGPATGVHIRGMTGLAVSGSLDVVMSEGYGTVLAAVVGTPSAPDAPTGPVATAGDGTASLSFSPPVGNGGRVITSYQYSTNGGSTWTTLPTAGSGPLTATVTGLTNGTPYSVLVRAVNVVGAGAAATAASVTPAAPLPPAPTGPSPVGLTSTGVGAAVQTVTVPLADGDALTLMDGAAAVDAVTVAGVGTYRVNAASHAITFTPVLGYSGVAAGVTFRVTDAAHLSGTAVYVPTTTKPPAPAPKALRSSGTAAQTVKVPLAAGQTLTLLDAAGDPNDTVHVPRQGSYATGSGGAIGFTPVAGFHATANAVALRVSDAYDQHGDSTYTATVTRIPALPRIDRSDWVSVPSKPREVKGPERRTKAFDSTFKGVDAHPIPALGKRQLTKGQATTLSGDGLFEFDRARLTAKGRREVQIAVTNLGAADRVRCEGYTDYAGKVRHEVELSGQRARAVCDALRKYGATVTTDTKGYGPARPAVVGGTAKSRKENRRVVIVVTG